MKPYVASASLYAAPKDVFADYDRVMSRLTREWRMLEDGNILDIARCSTSKRRDVEARVSGLLVLPWWCLQHRHTHRTPQNANDNSRASTNTRGDNRRYRERTHARETTTTTSNNRSTLVIRNKKSKGKARKHTPYDRGSHGNVPTKEKNSPERCTDVASGDGKPCDISRCSSTFGHHATCTRK
jgi:hypothetical protein